MKGGKIFEVTIILISMIIIVLSAEINIPSYPDTAEKPENFINTETLHRSL